MLSDFRKEANSISDFSVDALAGVLESTVAEKIVAILNDPDVMQARGTALKSESALQSFAATKAKSLGLTSDELAVLMNSAYIYLPFINSMIQKVDGNDVSLVMNGGEQSICLLNFCSFAGLILSLVFPSPFTEIVNSTTPRCVSTFCRGWVSELNSILPVSFILIILSPLF